MGGEGRSGGAEGKSDSFSFCRLREEVRSNICTNFWMQSLCNNCGLEYERDKRLPPWAKNLHYTDVPIAGR